MLIGTLADLAAFRDAWRKASAAADAFGRLGTDAELGARLLRRADELGTERFAALLPCMLCQVPQLVDVQVGGKDGEQDATPGNVLRGLCNASITAEVDAACALAERRTGRAGPAGTTRWRSRTSAPESRRES